MKRDREQTGSVIRKGNFWYARYADWRIENGERIRKQGLIHKLGPIRTEHAKLRRPPEYVERLQRDFMETVNSTLKAPDACSTISQFVDTVWLAGSVEDQDIYSSSSFDTYKYYWKTKLKPYVGDYLLRDFTTTQAEAALNNIKSLHPDISKATLHKSYVLCSARSSSVPSVWVFEPGIHAVRLRSRRDCRRSEHTPTP